ncbi:MAG TPA: hypothetical protein VHL53_05360 [Acidimicrobiia bacterium]|nr:hypothetical protein [Acidimicrobiia bacterium]
MLRSLGLRRVMMTAAAGVAAMVVVGGGVARAAPGGSAAGRGAARPDIRRVLVLSLPGTTWADVAGARVPNLDRLLAASAVGSTSVRAVERRTRPGDGYATIGAGTAAAGVARVEGLAFDADELSRPDLPPLAERARAVAGPGAAVVTVATPEIARRARHTHRGAEIGALGEALARAGVSRGVVGNADTGAGGSAADHREVALALADHEGRVPTGSVGAGLLAPDGAGGPRLDPDRAVAAFRAAWDVPGRAVVVFEASNLARTPDRPTLEEADALVGRLLAEVDPAHDAVIVTGPSNPGDQTHLTVAALRAPGVPVGLLDSATTRRVGYVTLPDLGPTVLGLLGMARPDSMEGRPYTAHARSFGAPPVARFIEADRESRFRDRMLGPVAGTYVTVEILLSLAVGFVLSRCPGRRKLRAAFDFIGLWLLAVVPLTFFGAVLDLDHVGPYLAWVMGGGAVLAVAAAALRDPFRPLAVLLGLLFGLHIADVVTGAHLQISTVFGYSPTVGGRFAGFGNLAYGQLAAAAILLAGLLVVLIEGRWGLWAGLAVLAVGLAADGLPFWGSDVGGVLASVPAFALVALGLAGRKVSWRRVVAFGAGAVVAVTGLGFLDLLRPAGSRTHLGRLFEQIGHDGFQPFSDAIQRKIAENLSVIPTSIWIPLVPSVLAFYAWLAYGSSPILEEIRRRAPSMRPALVGLLICAVLGMALNDSGIAVPAMMLGVLNPVLVRLALRTPVPARP